MNKEMCTNIENYVFNFLKENTRPELIFHDYTHTSEVARNAAKIGIAEKLSDEEQELVVLAAWFHDTGYTVQCEDHEKFSCKIAREYLLRINYPEENIEAIEKCIMATKMPQSPATLLEKIICDADLLHLGKKSFSDKNELFRLEIEKTKGKTYSEHKWLMSSLDFISHHEYFTEYAKENYSAQKRKNFIYLQKKLHKLLTTLDTNQLKKEKIELEKEKIIEKSKSEKRSDRGIETMFRNVMKTHIAFTQMADGKAHIMISVNTLILTAVVAFLARKLDTNPNLILPTAILSIVSLTTLVYATLVTKPKITSGICSKDDIIEKKANLLFFGNFYNMKLPEFTWGIKQLMEDRDYLYDIMIRDFHSLGQVLARKYKYLNICYNIFIYGMIISILAFGIAVLFFHGTDLRSLIH